MSLVSAIMPTTATRERFWPQAVSSFLSQDWTEKELVVLFSGPGQPPDFSSPEIRVCPYEGLENIGVKRNAACDLARGEYIVHWDDDDWSAPQRITDQIDRLRLNRGLSVTGYHSCLFWDGARVFEIIGPGLAVGSSLCYRKDHWAKNPFLPVRVGEDNRFLHRANRGGHFVGSAGGAMLVCRIHPENTSPKSPRAQNYHPRPLEVLPMEFPRVV